MKFARGERGEREAAMGAGRPVHSSRDTDSSRDEVRELAEAIGLYRSAMRHLSEREAARPWAMPGGSPRRHRISLRTGLLLLPALAAALILAILLPGIGHWQQGSNPAAGAAAQSPVPGNTEARAGVDDTVLMNQIDSEVSEEVPDALAPLADLSEQTTTNNTQTVSEKKNVTQN